MRSLTYKISDVGALHCVLCAMLTECVAIVSNVDRLSRLYKISSIDDGIKYNEYTMCKRCIDGIWNLKHCVGFYNYEL